MWNMNSQPLTGCLLAALVAASFAGPGLASDDLQPAELEQLVVTASFEPVSLQDVTGSVTVITRAQIEQRQVRFVAELLRDVPGFAVSQAGGPGALTQVRVRGAEANQMLVLVDGIRANDAAASDEFQWQYALTSNIERIEIVRGPQSAIWGSEAVSGVINIIRRKDHGERRASVRAEAGSFGTVDLSTDGAWTFDALSLRAGLAHYETDGINVSRSGAEKDGSDNSSMDIGLDWIISDALSLGASGQLVDASNDYDGTDFMLSGLPEDADLVTEAEQAYWRSELRFMPPGSAWSANASLNFTDTDNRNFAAGALANSTAAQTLELRARASRSWGGEPDGAQHRVTVAVDRRSTDFSQRGEASVFGDPNQDQSFDNNGIAAEYLAELFDGFDWTLSARYDDYSDFDSVATWRLAASHQVMDTVRVRGSYGTGSKTPTFTERYGFFEDFFIGNPDLKPETSRGWEFGVESSWLEGRLSLGGALFATSLQDEIDGFVFDPGSGGFTARNKSDDSDRRGLELTAGWEMLDGLDLGAVYTFTDATQTNPFGEDIRELRRPRHMASLAANYRFAQDRANLNLNINYTGEQLDVFYDPVMFTSTPVALPAFTVTDLAFAWRLNDALELLARVSNLTDEDYEEILGFARPGRAWYGGLRGRFDF